MASIVVEGPKETRKALRESCSARPSFSRTGFLFLELEQAEELDTEIPRASSRRTRAWEG